MKALGFRDSSDPVILNRLGFRELGHEESMTDRLEQTLEETDKFQKELIGKNR